MKNYRANFAKTTILAATISSGAMLTFQPFTADAQLSYKKAVQKACYNSQGQLTGYGATCEFGGSTCTANSCY